MQDQYNDPTNSLPKSPKLDFATLELLQEGVWITDKSDRLIFANAVMGRIAGVEVSQLTGKTLRAFPADTVRNFLGYFDRAKESLLPCEYECQVVTPGRNMSWQGGWLKPILENDQYAGMLCTVRDISQQKEHETRLSQSESIARSIIDASPVPSAVNDNAGNITYLNAAFVDAFGYTTEDLHTLEDWWPKAYPDPDYREWVITAWQKHLTESRTTSTPFKPLELKVRCKSGETKTIIASATALEITVGSGLHLVTLYDITERTLAESVLQESRQKLELAIDGADLGMWVWDITSGSVSFNERWCSMLGYSRSEVASDLSSWQRLVHPDDWAAINAALEPHLKGETPAYESEHRMRHKDGHWVWILDRGKVVERTPTGEPLRAAGIHQDITSRKQLKLEGTELLRRIETLILHLNEPNQGVSSAPRNPRAEAEQRLTRRQIEILKLIASGKTSAQIAQNLQISRETAIGHRREIMRRLELHSVAELTRYAIEHQLLAN